MIGPMTTPASASGGSTAKPYMRVIRIRGSTRSPLTPPHSMRNRPGTPIIACANPTRAGGVFSTPINSQVTSSICMANENPMKEVDAT